MKVHHLKPAEGSKKSRIRAGRGESGHRGKTAGRGMKGQKARGKTRVGFEGGQTPLQRRLPKMRGFKNPFRVEFDIVNVGKVDAAFKSGEAVTPESLRDRGLVRKSKRPVKILGQGEVKTSLKVKVDAMSATASEKIRAAGGTAETTIEAVREAREARKTKRRKGAVRAPSKSAKASPEPPSDAADEAGEPGDSTDAPGD